MKALLVLPLLLTPVSPFGGGAVSTPWGGEMCRAR